MLDKIKLSEKLILIIPKQLGYFIKIRNIQTLKTYLL